MASVSPPRRRRILVIPDKFKGTLTSLEAARAIRRGWHAAQPGDRLELRPLSDGGDGFGEVLRALLGARARGTRVVDAAHRPCRVPWWHDPGTKTAIVESARVIGLAMLPAGRFHPFELDTRGLGQLLLRLVERGVRRCLLGIGGSATNDGGFGLARALGWQFMDRRGRSIDRWTGLRGATRVESPKVAPLRGLEIVVAVDVQNRLLGAHGCSRVYGPQKGLRPRDMALAESCLARVARLMREHSGTDWAVRPGAGAAGGLGFGLPAFAGARLEPGIEMYATYTGLDEWLHGADLVVTGEGALDASTLMGKGVGEIARRCRRLGIPCIGLAGRAEAGSNLESCFDLTRGIVPEVAPATLALREPAHCLAELARRVAGET